MQKKYLYEKSLNLIKKNPDFLLYAIPFYGSIKEFSVKLKKKEKINWMRAGGWFLYSLPGAIIKGPAIVATVVHFFYSPTDVEICKRNDRRENKLEQTVEEKNNFPVDSTYFYEEKKENRKVYKE